MNAVSCLQFTKSHKGIAGTPSPFISKEQVGHHGVCILRSFSQFGIMLVIIPPA